MYTWQWENAFEDMPEIRVTVELRQIGQAPELLLTHEGPLEVPVCLQHRSGWLAALERIERVVAVLQVD